jgi:hypothetical protein
VMSYDEIAWSILAVFPETTVEGQLRFRGIREIKLVEWFKPPELHGAITPYFRGNPDYEYEILLARESTTYNWGVTIGHELAHTYETEIRNRLRGIPSGMYQRPHGLRRKKLTEAETEAEIGRQVAESIEVSKKVEDVCSVFGCLWVAQPGIWKGLRPILDRLLLYGEVRIY